MTRDESRKVEIAYDACGSADADGSGPVGMPPRGSCDCMSLVDTPAIEAPGVILAVDVDGVLLDPSRGGRGSWQEELRARHGIDPAALNTLFFSRYWKDIIIGRIPIEPALASALEQLDVTVDLEDVLTCWFESDFHLNQDVVDQVSRWNDEGLPVVLATNQEHRRAAYLAKRLGRMFAIHSVLYSAELGFVKDDARFFAAADLRLGIREQATAMVLLDDDSRNLEAARRSGWLGVRFGRDRPWRQDVCKVLHTGAH